ncbi:hypothetical protein D1B31_18905 [Neobacillus notoginsengisoli]|uniref:Uncharacterized protein n=2 Tax=Neobacillus notoginsengisoli TaxID=1578198 RepID=A0A417YPF6_9BACI|nr:hypothetical protein D1B31_18905 [Neobacillus notoginsengisoli]
MSLTKTNLAEVVKKQYFHKLRANIDAFSALVGIQVLAIVFSLAGVGSTGMSGGGMIINVNYFSADVVIVFTFFWAFITAITVNTKVNRFQDFTFVTNRVSSGLSNILFLATAGLLGSMTAVLSGYLLKVIIYLFKSQPVYSIRSGMEEILLGIVVAFLYILLVSSIGFLFSSITAISKVFIFLIPVIIVGMLFLGGIVPNEYFIKGIEFFVGEKNVLLFALKTLSTSALIFGAGIAILRRREVRQ